MTKIVDAGTGANTQYSYTGDGRRLSLTLGNGLAQTFDTDGAGAAGYPGLDRFGRVADLHFIKTSNSSTVHRYEYKYDLAGNRTSARVVQKDFGSTSNDNTRSQAYGYDGLQRLVAAETGALQPDGSIVSVRPTPSSI